MSFKLKTYLGVKVQVKSSKSMLIKNEYSNLLQDSNFFVFFPFFIISFAIMKPKKKNKNRQNARDNI